MKVGIHNYKGRSFILLYTPWPDVCVQIHPSVRKYAEHIAQASYYFKGHKGISIYVLPNSKLNELKGVKVSRSLFHMPYILDQRNKIMKTYSIRAGILKTAPPETLDVIVRDVEVFADKKTPKKFFEPYVKEIEKIIPNTEPKFATNLEIDILGKQDYVPSCLIDINADFFLKSCASLLVNGYYDPFAACVYCYAKGPQRDTPIKRLKRVSQQGIIEQIREIRKQRAKQGKATKHIRFGKVSEAGSKLTREQLVTTLEVCVEAELSPIFPTKFLEYDPVAAELLRKTDAALLYSIGNDILEPGAVANGCTNDFRFEQAIHYYEQKIKAGLYLLIDARNFDNPLFKKNLERAITLHKDIGIEIQLLPIRPIGKKQLSEITGAPHEDMLVRDQQKLFDQKPSPGGYARTANNQYYATIIDKRFLELIKEPGISMCHHNKETTWCGGCLHKVPDELKSFPTQEASPPRFKRHKRREKIDKNGFLFK